MSEDKQTELRRLAEEVMSVVLDVAARRLMQATEEIHTSKIAPLKQALRNCQTLTPSLMSDEACRERLKEINSYVYRVLE